MSHAHEIPAELAEWIARSLDGRSTPEEFAQLERELATNEAALAYYLEFVTVSVGLIDQVGVLPESLRGLSQIGPEDLLTSPISAAPTPEPHLDPIRFAPEIPEVEKTRLIEEYAQAQLDAFLQTEHEAQQHIADDRSPWNVLEAVHRVKDGLEAASRWSLKMAQTTAACTLLVLVLLIVYLMLKGDPEVAVVQETVAARWAEPVEVGIDLRPRELQLQEGYAKILMKKGAEVIVQAPATFELQSRNRLFLQSGSMTAVVPESAQGFTIDTPYSHIVDYGTEFGVLAGNGHHTEVHVFTGQVGLGSNKHQNPSEATLLKTDQAALIGRENQITQVSIASRPRLFTRTLSPSTNQAIPGRQLCLADIIGGGNGLGTGQRNIFVDPKAGYVETIYSNSEGNQYFTLTANPFVDGVFIPDGHTPQIVSSEGHVFGNCPPTNGQCAANLGVTPPAGLWAWSGNERTGIVRFEGQTYGDPSRPFLMMHANLGITFDLNSIRNLCPATKITRFTARTGIADFIEPAPCNADFWIIVDGKVRASQRNVRRKGILSDISITLSPTDRFLTLITTDGGDTDQLGDYQRSFACDWCVFAHPVLLLDTGESHLE